MNVYSPFKDPRVYSCSPLAEGTALEGRRVPLLSRSQHKRHSKHKHSPEDTYTQMQHQDSSLREHSEEPSAAWSLQGYWQAGSRVMLRQPCFACPSNHSLLILPVNKSQMSRLFS